MKTEENILIIGAGLCGSLLALRLGQRGYNVRVMERRSDLRKENISAGRSINLALSNRGIKALKMVGLENKVKSLCIPMHGRMLHDKSGNTKLSKYSGRNGEYINSISRELLTLQSKYAEAEEAESSRGLPVGPPPAAAYHWRSRGTGGSHRPNPSPP